LFRLPLSVLASVLVWIIGSFSPALEAHAEEAVAAPPVAAEATPETKPSAQDAESPASDGSSIEVSLGSKGLRVRTKDGRFKFQFGGRLHVDGTYHLGDTPGDVPVDPPNPTPTRSLDPTDGAEIRRARFAAKATVYDVWQWVGEVDFADNETNIKDFTLGYTGFKNTTIAVGNQKQPYSLSLEMSSNDIPFVERSIDNGQNESSVDRAIGVRVDTNGDHWFVAAGIYGDTVTPQKTPGDEGWGLAGRAIYAPIIEEREVVHLGLRAAFRRPEEEDKSLRIRDETTHMSNYRVVDTGDQGNIDSAVLFGPEAAVAVGPLWVFGEYTRAQVRRNGFDTAAFDSGHIAAAWMLTGESRATTYAIKSGEFKGIVPFHNFSLKNGGIGAWEVAVRYAYLNLNAGGASNPGAILGGKEHTLSTALNWYVNPNVRFMLNWNHIIETDVSDQSPIADSNQEAQGMDIFTVRAQFAF
jgi:phosphate-selective porin OprO/OprP